MSTTATSLDLPKKARINKRIVLACLVVAVIAIFFWTQSRVPALDEKAQMGDRTTFSGIGFDIVLAVDPEAPLWERATRTAVNWGYTNWKGMTFGLLFAAGALVLFSQIPRQRSKNPVLNSLLGAAGGAPLGVCVNCVTPIAHGMYKAGLRLETVLATMVSSPTLNVIVLTMSFTLLPMHFALTKVLGVALMIVIVIPVIVRLFASRGDINPHTQLQVEQELDRVMKPDSQATDESCELPAVCELPGPDSWASAIIFTVKEYIRQLLYIVKATLPLMLLAGILGAFLIETLPLERLQSLDFTVVALVTTALFGALLPVPIAFDVLICSVLIDAGVNPGLVMALLFTLGIFSVYPMMIIWRNISARLAGTLLIAATLVGSAAGAGLYLYDKYTTGQLLHGYTPLSAEEKQQALLDIGVNECQKLQTGAIVERCLGDFLIKQFDRGLDTAACSQYTWSNVNLQQRCERAARYHVQVATADAERNPTACNQLSNPDSKRCELDYAKRRIDKHEFYEMCDQLKSNSNYRQCRKIATLYLLGHKNSLAICNVLPVEEIRECEKYYHFQVAIQLRSSATCDRFSDSETKADCELFVAKNYLKRKQSDISVCDDVSRSAQKNQCIGIALSMQAINAGIIEICDHLPGAENCRENVIEAAIDRRVSMLAINQLSWEGFVESSLDHGRNNFAPVDAPVTATIYEHGGIALASFAHNERPASTGDTGFIKRDLAELGISEDIDFELSHFLEPLDYGRGITSGDYNNDGWPDFAVASSRGIKLYRNLGDKSFARDDIDPNAFPNLEVFYVGFVDINNDGWLDLFASTYAHENVILINQAGRFSATNVFPMPAIDNILTIAAGFADIDNDGLLDIALGNWAFGSEKGFIPSHSMQNLLLLNRNDGFEPVTFDEERGDTLALLLSDINNDNRMDLLIGNDFTVPDQIYFNTNGSLERLEPDSSPIPVTPIHTMSYDSADFNNDLHLDLFSVDMSFGEGLETGYCGNIDSPAARQRCEFLLDGAIRLNNQDAGWCATLESADRQRCLIAIFREIAVKLRDENLCAQIPVDKLLVEREICLNLIKREDKIPGIDLNAHLPQVQKNVLLWGSASGAFTEAGRDIGVEESFWSWNAKGADLDNDGWQDIYVANGFQFGERRDLHSNVFYHNRQGQSFADRTEEFGLEDYLSTPSYVYIDYDLDGDLDIVATGVMAPLRFYENQESANHAITFEVRDYSGNRFGIGAKIVVYHGSNQHQIREIKASGGFLSADSALAHFGLGGFASIDKLEIRWPDGEVTTIDRSLQADRHYVIHRNRPGRSIQLNTAELD